MKFSIPKLPNLNIQFKLEGNWVKAIELPDKVAKSMRNGYDLATTKFANRLVKVIKRSIATGTPPPGGGVYWPPVSEKYRKKHPDGHTYYLTGLYWRSIRVTKTKTRFYIGVGSGKASGGGLHQKKSNLTLSTVASILEYGTEDGRIPERPLWRPALESIGGRQKLKTEIIKYIRKGLLAHGIKPNQVRYG